MKVVSVIIMMINCAYGFTFQATPDYSLEKLFNPQSSGWLGADISTSIHLANNTYVWLWGDTVYGYLEQSNGREVRNMQSMPHSSLAFVQSPPNSQPEFWFRQGDGGPDPFGVFTPQNPTDPNEIYWLVEGIMGPTTDKLVILAQTMLLSSSSFTQLGTDAIVVSNPFEHPSQWVYSTSRISTSNENLSWNSGIGYALDGYFYLIGLGNSNAYLAKISEVDMMNFNWQGVYYWSQGDQWLQNNAFSLVSLFSSDYTEGTLQYHPFLQQWFIILCQAYNGNIDIAYSASPTGPWTKETIYTIPSEYINGTTISYAGKSHPEYAANNEIVFTYNVNAPSVDFMLADLDIYHPKFVRVSISE